MSDNPEGAAFTLGVEDDGSLQVTVDALQAKFLALQAAVTGAFSGGEQATARFSEALKQVMTENLDVRVKALQADIEKAFLTGTKLAEEYREDLNRVSGTILEQVEQVDALEAAFTRANEAAHFDVQQQIAAQATADIEKLVGAYQQEAAAIEEVAAAQTRLGQFRQATGPDQFQGMQPSVGEMSGGIDEGGGGAGSGGSLFGVGRAALVAGRTFKSPELSGLGEGLYMAEGLKLASKQFEALNATLEEAGSKVPLLTDALIGLDIPMAGLVAVAAPLALAVVGVALAFKHFQDVIDAGEKQLEAFLGAQQKYYDFIQTATTQEAIDKKKALDDGTSSLEKQQKENADIIRMAMEMPAGYGTDKEVVDYARQDVTTALSPAVQDAIKKYDELSKTMAENSTFATRLEQTIKAGGLAANDAAAQQKIQTDRTIADIQSRASAEAEAQTLIETGTSKAVEAKLAANGAEYKQNEDSIAQLKKTGDTTQATSSAIQQLEDRNRALAIETTILVQDGVIPLIKAREEEVEATKKAVAANQELNKARTDYEEKRAATSLEMVDQMSSAIYKEAEAESQYHRGSLQDIEARSQIATKEARDETKLKQDTADHSTDIGTKLGQKEVQDKLNFNRQLADDQTKIDQDYQKLVTDANRQGIEDKIDHEQKLADINSQTAQNDQQALLDRNFLALAKQGISHQQAVDKENSSYQEREAKLARHLTYQETDLATHMAQEVAQQNTAYNRKLVDAEQAAIQEIAQQRVVEGRKRQELINSETNQLNDLTHAETYKIQLLQQSMDNQIAVIQATEMAKLQILQNTMAATQQAQIAKGARERSAVERPGAPSISSSFAAARTYDDGGSFSAGEPFMKGDISEMLQFGKTGYNLGGAAMVFPMQSGTATPTGKGGKHIENLNVIINAPPGATIDAQMIKHEIYNILEQDFPE